jgi:hypothetical protein
MLALVAERSICSPFPSPLCALDILQGQFDVAGVL